MLSVFGWLARRLCVCGLFVACAAGVARATTIGNISSFVISGQDITFTISDGSKVRLSILAGDLARVTIAPGGTLVANVSRAVVAASWPSASFATSDNSTALTITTAGMKLVVKKTPFVLECRDLADNLVLTDDPTRRIQWDSSRTQVYKSTQSNENYLGLGWRTLGLVRNGYTFTMRNVASYGSTSTFYSGVPLWYGMRNGSVYGVFFDDTSWGTIDTGAASSSYMSFKNLGGQADYYYFAGPTMAGILDRYTTLTGRPYMPPRWSVGYQQSRWSYVPQSQVLSIANEFRTRSIPCDVIYLDIDYMKGGWALSFDPAKFPDPAGMLTTLHNQGFHVVANISPFLFTSDPMHSTALAGDHFLKKANGAVLNGWHDYWYFVGGATTGSMSWLDFSKTTTRTWWQGQHSSFLGLGIDGIWNDLNEPDELGGAWPTNVKYDFDGAPVDHNKTSTQYSLLETSLSYAALSEQYPARRPFVVSRGGYAGIQRYSTLWTGDNTSDWTNDYKRNIPMGLSMSISGNPHNGHDIGGFFGSPTYSDKPSGELYARWMQSGVFSPFCRQHHDGWGNYLDNGVARPFVEPWQFGSTVEGICRDYVSLRYRLMPYLYTQFASANATGEPIQRPTLYDFPADSNTLTQNYDFMFGPWMLVSPVTTAGAGTWNTYLPSGASWIDWWDDSLRTGGQTVNRSSPTAQLPIYVRGGAIIPTAPVMQYDGQSAIGQLTLELYPVNQISSYTLYEDDGLSWDYQSGVFAKTAFTMSGVGDSFAFSIAARQGSFVPAARSYLLKVHRWPGNTNVPTLNDQPLVQYGSLAALQAAGQGYFIDTAAAILYARFGDTGAAMAFALNGTPIPTVPGDFDSDGDVDLVDFGRFQLCMLGDGVLQADPLCEKAHLDADVDVDGADAARFMGCLSGAGVIGDPDCAN